MRTARVTIPAAELAIAHHHGSHHDVDITDWDTEIGWPVLAANGR